MSGIEWSKKDVGWVPMVEIYGTKMVEIDSIETIEVVFFNHLESNLARKPMDGNGFWEMCSGGHLTWDVWENHL
jgi:hypothetical protein